VGSSKYAYFKIEPYTIIIMDWGVSVVVVLNRDRVE
jgi:hypothetical protein